MFLRKSFLMKSSVVAAFLVLATAVVLVILGVAGF